MENNRIAVVGIIVEKTENVSKVNEILHDYSDFIIGKM
ncbi:CopG family transcriptional regulator, partial [Brachyspira catarrhinii]